MGSLNLKHFPHTPTMLRISRSIKQTQSLISLQTSRPLSVSSIRMSDKSSLDANKGSVGKEFTPQGKAGGTAQEIGGPFDKEGAIGKQFTTVGSVGGTAQSAAQQMQGEKKPVFDKDGAVGKQFNPDGAIGKHFNPDGTVGGTVQENLGSGKK